MQLPSLNSLKTFEAAARRGSFNQAALELNVTPSAVSHQIRQLESQLNVLLFRRLDKQVVLTKEGQSYYMGVQRGINTLLDATKQLMEQVSGGAIRLSVAPIFATRWLMPKLDSFQIAEPDWELSITATTAKTDFLNKEFDLAIRHGDGNWPGMHSRLLMREKLTLVCAPSLLPKLSKTSDIEKLPGLIVEFRPEGWACWLNAAGLTNIKPKPGARFQNNAQALEAAIAGAGIAIADLEVIQRELVLGQLVQPFDIVPNNCPGYFLVYPVSDKSRHQVKVFEHWIMGQLSKPS